MNHVKTTALGGLVVASAAAVYFLLPAPSPEPASAPAAQVTPSTAPAAPSWSARTVASVTDDRKTRDFVFKQLKDRFTAEGVFLEQNGGVTLDSQGTGGRISQRLVAAELRKDGKLVRTLALSSKPGMEVSASDKRGSLVYRGMFEGLDVEYRYDGKDLEEFVHVSDELKKEIAESGASLELTALYPGLNAKSTLVEGPGVPPPGSHKVPAGMRPLAMRESIMLLVDGRHRYGIPPAVAMDEAEGRYTLARRTEFTSQGLQMAMSLPAEFVASSTGHVVIDPSLLDGPRAVSLNTWTGTRALVKDDQGTFHVAYWAVDRGCWTAMYVKGDGTNWGTPVRIAEHTSGECTHYQPSIAIDGRGTLHVVYADWGSGDAANRGTSEGRHRVKYAFCPERCRSGVWQGHTFLYPSAGGHQYDYTIAVDGNNTVGIAFYDEGTSGMRYLTNDGTGWVNNGIIITDAYYANLLNDNNGIMHMIAMPWWGGGPTESRIKHMYYDPGASTWVNEPPLNPTPGFSPYKGHYYLASTVDADNNIHVGVGIYDYNVSHYRAAYGRWDPVSRTWRDQGLVENAVTLPEDWLSLTVDNNRTAHIMYQRALTPPRIMYAQKPAGGVWTAPVKLMPSGPGQVQPHLRARLGFPAFGNSVPAGLLDMVYVDDFVNLRYFSTGAPVENPVLTRPADHSYINSTAPTFEWRKLPSDTGSNTIYRLEIAASPLFDTLLVSKDVNTNRYTLTGTAPELLVDGQYYYWRVRAANSSGPGPYSAIFEVGVDTQPPSPFDLVAPANNSDPGTRTPTFQWTQSVN